MNLLFCNITIFNPRLKNFGDNRMYIENQILRPITVTFGTYRHGTCPNADISGGGNTDTGCGLRGLPRNFCCADIGN